MGNSSDEFTSIFQYDGIQKLSASDVSYKIREGPKKIKHYILGETLGEGSYAKVREALDQRTNKLFAIKIMKKTVLHKIPGGEESVKREIEIQQRINHVNCVSLIDFFADEEKGKLYIVSEYVGGGSLQELCERAPNKRLPLCQARHLFSQLLDALNYLHSINILHRDVKPDNMLLTMEGVLKLSDFGVAIDFTSKEKPKSNGSPAFQPPEAAAEKGSLTGPPADIWAAGITLYIMIVGKFPFEGANLYGLFENIASGSYEVPDWMDSVTANLIQRMLEVDHRTRATIQQIREHEWMTAKMKREPFVRMRSSATAFRTTQGSKMFSCKCTIA